MFPTATYPPEADSPERTRKLAALRERDPDWRDTKMMRRDETLQRPPYYLKQSRP